MDNILFVYIYHTFTNSCSRKRCINVLTDINLWALPARAESGTVSQSVSSSPDSFHPAEFPLEQEASLSLLQNHVTQTVCHCVCVCVCVLHGWGGSVTEPLGPLLVHTHTHSSHPSPGEGNLSAAHDVTSCIQTGPRISLSTLAVSTCSRGYK